MTSIVCPQCKGRRSVFDPTSLFLTIGFPVALLLESGSSEGFTRKKCPTCDGRGYFHLPSKRAGALARPEPEGPSDKGLKAVYWEAFKNSAACGAKESWLAGLRRLVPAAVLAGVVAWLWGRPVGELETTTTAEAK
jgi:hypothetical protein